MRTTLAGDKIAKPRQNLNLSMKTTENLWKDSRQSIVTSPNRQLANKSRALANTNMNCNALLFQSLISLIAK